MPEERKAWQGIAALLAFFALPLGNAFNVIFSDLSIGTPMWSLCNIVSACTQWALPVMAMLAGSVFLASGMRLKTAVLWKRYIPLAALSCVIWWLFAAVAWMHVNRLQDLDWITFRECMAEVLEAPANIGFCQMVFSFFLLYPLLHRIAENEKLTLYGILLIFAMALLETVIQFIPYVSAIAMFADQLNWGYYRAWAFYLLCGAWIARHELKWQTCLVIYSLGIISTGAMAALTAASTTFHPGYVNDFIGYTSPFTGIQAAAVMLFVRRTAADMHAPKLVRLTRNLWYSAPVLFVTSVYTERLTENFLSSDAGSLVCGALINAVAAFLVMLALGALPGFRALAGDYSHKEA